MSVCLLSAVSGEEGLSVFLVVVGESLCLLVGKRS